MKKAKYAITIVFLPILCFGLDFRVLTVEVVDGGVELCAELPFGLQTVDLFTNNGYKWELSAKNVKIDGNLVTWIDNCDTGFKTFAFGDGASDIDLDGLTDASEQLVYGTLVNDPDSDGDGFNDGPEILNNLNPNEFNIQLSPPLPILYKSSSASAGIYGYVGFLSNNRYATLTHDSYSRYEWDKKDSNVINRSETDYVVHWLNSREHETSGSISNTSDSVIDEEHYSWYHYTEWSSGKVTVSSCGGGYFDSYSFVDPTYGFHHPMHYAATSDTYSSYYEVDDIGYYEVDEILSDQVTLESISAKASGLLSNTEGLVWGEGYVDGDRGLSTNIAYRITTPNSVSLCALDYSIDLSHLESSIIYNLKWHEVFVPDDGAREILSTRYMQVGTIGTSNVVNEFHIDPPVRDGFVYVSMCGLDIVINNGRGYGGIANLSIGWSDIGLAGDGEAMRVRMYDESLTEDSYSLANVSYMGDSIPLYMYYDDNIHYRGSKAFILALDEIDDRYSTNEYMSIFRVSDGAVDDPTCLATRLDKGILVSCEGMTVSYPIPELARAKIHVTAVGFEGSNFVNSIYQDIDLADDLFRQMGVRVESVEVKLVPWPDDLLVEWDGDFYASGEWNGHFLPMSYEAKVLMDLYGTTNDVSDIQVIYVNARAWIGNEPIAGATLVPSCLRDEDLKYSRIVFMGGNVLYYSDRGKGFPILGHELMHAIGEVGHASEKHRLMYGGDIFFEWNLTPFDAKRVAYFEEYSILYNILEKGIAR